MILFAFAAVAFAPLQVGETRGQVAAPPKIKFDPTRPQVAVQPKNQELKFELFSLSYRKAEDEDGKDEPYLFTAGFRLDIGKDLRGFFIGGAGIKVFPVGVLDRNNLGYLGNGCARTQRRYPITGQVFTTIVPTGGRFQVAGIMTILMEEDGFNASQMQRLRADFPLRFKGTLEELQKDSVRQPALYIDDMIRRIGRWVYDFQAARYINFFIPGGTGDPDDVGGTQVALAINFGTDPGPNITRRGIQVTAGDWFAAALKFTEIRRSGANQAVNFPFLFPAGNINLAPPKARWLGEARISGYVKVNLSSPVP